MQSYGSSSAGRVVEEKYIKFVARGNVCRVVAEEEKCWRLDDGGRVAKKKTEGEVWIWFQEEGR
jgi:hypothetical protein